MITLSKNYSSCSLPARANSPVQGEQTFSEQLASLSNEKNPACIRNRVLRILGEHGCYIDGLMRESRNFHWVEDLTRKIATSSREEDYSVGGYIFGQFNRCIPVLVIKKTSSAIDLFSSSRLTSIPIQSRGEVDYLVQALSKMNIPWDFSSGCEARADLGCRILVAMNIPSEMVKKVWIKGYLRPEQEDKRSVIWNWHIAPMVETASKEKFVVDPYFNKTTALDKKQWVSYMKPLPGWETGEISGRSTCDMVADKEVPVTPEIFASYRKTLIVHTYASKAPEDSFLQKVILINLPPPPTLGSQDSPALVSTKFSSFTESSQSDNSPSVIRLNLNSSICTVS